MIEAFDTDPMEHFDPEARRNPAVPAVPVKLADGRTWHFAAATDRYRPCFVGDICTGAECYRGFPPACQPAMDALIAEAAELPTVAVATVVQAAVVLLRRAHNLSAAEASALLHVGAAELPEIIRALSAACRGETADEDLVDALADEDLGADGDTA